MDDVWKRRRELSLENRVSRSSEGLEMSPAKRPRSVMGAMDSLYGMNHGMMGMGSGMGGSSGMGSGMSGGSMGGSMGMGMGGMGMGGMGMGGMGSGMGSMGMMNPFATGSGTGSYHPGMLSGSGSLGRSFPVVKLRGLPFSCLESDVIEFFGGLDIVDILFVRRNNRFCGEAFVVFGNPLQVEFALQKNRMNMGRRYVEVFRTKKAEYYSAIAAEMSSENSSSFSGNGTSSSRPSGSGKMMDPSDFNVLSGVLKMRGLPFTATKQDIMEFFSGFELKEGNVHVVSSMDGRNTGEAFAEFSSVEEAKAAMSKNRCKMGSRYVELFPSSRDEAAARACSKSLK